VVAAPEQIGDENADTRQRGEQRAGEQVAPVGDGEDQNADGEAEQPAARERRELDDEQEPEQQRQRDAQPVTALESQVERREDEQRDVEHDREMVRVAGERVRPVDARPVDRAVDVDRARTPGERGEHRPVEVVSRARGEKLKDAVGRVCRHSGDEEAERTPVESRRAAPQARHRREEEAEVECELDHPLAELREGVAGLEVEVAGQVDQQEGDEESEH